MSIIDGPYEVSRFCKICLVLQSVGGRGVLIHFEGDGKFVTTWRPWLPFGHEVDDTQCFCIEERMKTLNHLWVGDAAV